MSTYSGMDLQMVVNGILKAQLAAMEASLVYWKTITEQHAGYANVMVQILQNVQAGEPTFAPSAQVLSAYATNNVRAMTQLAVKIASVALTTMGELSEISTERQ